MSSAGPPHARAAARIGNALFIPNGRRFPVLPAELRPASDDVEHAVQQRITMA